MAEEQAEELKIHEEQDGGVIVGGEDPKPESNDDEDDAPNAKNQTSDESHDDEEGHDEETAEERAERTERNRQRRKENKDRRKEYVESLKRELSARDSVINDLNQRISVVERKSTGSEMAQLDAAEKEAMQYYSHFKKANQEAIEQANGAAATDAQEKMFAAANRVTQIQNIKKAVNQRQSQPQPLDPRMVQHAQGWTERNSWYDPSGDDADSAMVLSIDARLAKENWNPTTAEYWEELDARVKKYLPHRVNSGYNRSIGNKGAGPRVPVAGSGGESSGGKPTGGYRLSADRVQALKDSGIWDDPEQRAKAVKNYQKYDKTQGASK